VLLVIVILVLTALVRVALTLIVLLVALGRLLIARGLSGLRLLALESSLGARLAILRVIGGRSLLRPLVLILNLVAKVVFLAFFGPINALLFRVFIFALLLALFVVSLCTHVLSCCWLLLLLASPCRLLSRLLLSLSLLLLGGLALLEVDQVMHGHHRLLAVLLALMVLALLLVLYHSRLVPGALWLLIDRAALLVRAFRHFRCLVLLLVLLCRPLISGCGVLCVRFLLMSGHYLDSL